MSRKRMLPLLAALAIPACGDFDGDGSDGSSGGSRAAGAEPLAASLSGGQEAPPVLTFASGASTFFISADRASVRFTLNTVHLSGATMAHVHVGPLGVDGPILFDLSTSAFVSPLEGTLRAADLRPQPSVATFDDALNAMRRGDTYVNAHTTSNPDGEIRGQIGPANLMAALAGSPAPTPGTGTATVALNGTQTELAFTLDVANLSGPPTQARIHVASAGLNGPAVFTLSSTMFDRSLRGTLTAADLQPQPTAGVVTFADAVDALLSGNAYLLVPTAAFPGGEIRGQLVAGGLSAAPTVPPGSILSGIPSAAPAAPSLVVPVILPVGAPLVLPLMAP